MHKHFLFSAIIIKNTYYLIILDLLSILMTIQNLNICIQIYLENGAMTQLLPYVDI